MQEFLHLLPLPHRIQQDRLIERFIVAHIAAKRQKIKCLPIPNIATEYCLIRARWRDFSYSKIFIFAPSTYSIFLIFSILLNHFQFEFFFKNFSKKLFFWNQTAKMSPFFPKIFLQKLHSIDSGNPMATQSRNDSHEKPSPYSFISVIH